MGRMGSSVYFEGVDGRDLGADGEWIPCNCDSTNMSCRKVAGVIRCTGVVAAHRGSKIGGSEIGLV